MKFRAGIEVLLGISVNLYLGSLGAEELGSSRTNMGTAEYYYLKGKQDLLSGNYEEADEAFKEAEKLLSEIETKGKKEEVSSIKKDRGVIEGEDVLNKAKAAFQEEKLDQALNLYQLASEIYPGNPDIHYNSGVIYLRKSDYLNATGEFETVISLDSEDSEAYYNLGIIYENFLNNKKKALNYYEKYLSCNLDSKEKKEVEAWVDKLRREVK